MDIKLMTKLARDAMNKSYSPYSGFKVGACIFAKNGKYYSGCNIESVSYTPTICAERCAICNAIGDDCKEFEAVMIVNSGQDYSYPCGVCRQMLSEFGYDMQVMVANSNDNIKKTTLKELLPDAFIKINK